MVNGPGPQKIQSISKPRVATHCWRIFLLLAFLASSCESRAQAEPLPNPRPTIVSWWKGEGNGDDSVGDNSDCEATAVTYAPGKVGRAMDFNGANSRLGLCDSPSLQLTGSLSIEGWVYVRAFNSHGMIFMRGDKRGGLDPYRVETIESGKILFHVESETENVNIEAPVKLKEWTHFAAVLDAAAGEMSLYINGIKAAQTVTKVRPLKELQLSQNAGAGIGNHSGWNEAPVNFPYNGLIDELTLYSGILTAAQIQGIFNKGSEGKVPPPVPAPVAGG